MDDKEAIINNLKDAGCSQEVIDSFIDGYQDKSPQELIDILRCHRCGLLEKLHHDQKQIDCLDYLIFNIKKR